MTRKNWILISIFFLASTSSLADANDQQFLYQVETELMYSDKLINPTSTIQPKSLALPMKQDSKRAFGLTEAKARLSWIHNNKTQLSLLLRPDSHTYTDASGQQVEFDSRTGQTFRQPSSLRFLDAYTLSVDAGDSFNFEVGVHESMSPVFMAYEPILEFGLNVRMVRKYSGMKILWKIDHDGFPKSQPEDLLGKRFYLHLFQASDDRNESYEQTNSTFDTAPTSQDPHMGLGFGYDWKADSDLSINSLIAYRRNKNQADQTTMDLFGRLAWEYRFTAFATRSLIANDIRFNRVSFALPNVNAKTLNQISTSLTLTSWIKANVAAYGGLHYGQSEHHVETDLSKASLYKGWQLDTGVKRIVNDVLVGHFVFAYESRERETAALTTGGFAGSKEPKKTIARFAIMLKYLLGGP
jgi:hypothetical protein